MKRATFLTALRRDTKGATAVEYGLILAFIVLAMLTSLKLVADSTITMWSGVSAKVTNAVSAANT